MLNSKKKIARKYRYNVCLKDAASYIEMDVKKLERYAKSKLIPSKMVNGKPMFSMHQIIKIINTTGGIKF